MKKLFDILLLIGVIVFLILLWNCSTVHGGTRSGRTLPSPQVVIPFAELRTNNQGGHDYYVKGKRVGYTRKNNMGSYDIYIKGRLKYKGAKFSGSPNTRLYGVNPSRSSGRSYYNTPQYKKHESREEYLERWSRQRQSMSRGVYWWQHFYPHIWGS